MRNEICVAPLAEVDEETSGRPLSESAIEVLAERTSPPMEAPAQPARKPEESGVSPSLELGRKVKSLKYGVGFVSSIEDEVVTVRFWKAGYKRFHKTEGSYPFESPEVEQHLHRHAHHNQPA